MAQNNKQTNKQTNMKFNINFNLLIKYNIPYINEYKLCSIEDSNNKWNINNMNENIIFINSTNKESSSSEISERLGPSISESRFPLKEIKEVNLDIDRKEELTFIKELNSLVELPHFDDSAPDNDWNKDTMITPSRVAFLVGVLDATGNIKISESYYFNKNNEFNIVIKWPLYQKVSNYELLNDLHSKFKIKNLKIKESSTYNTNKYNKEKYYSCLLITKTNIYNTILPILDHYKIYPLTEKLQLDFWKLHYIYYNDLRNYCEIIDEEDQINDYVNKHMIKSDYLDLDYFNDWLVGYTSVKGNFSKDKLNNMSYSISQVNDPILINDIHSLFSTDPDNFIYKNKDNIYTSKVSSNADIANVVDFFSHSYATIGYFPIERLRGTKLNQYISFLLQCKAMPDKYDNVNYPQYINDLTNLLNKIKDIKS